MNKQLTKVFESAQKNERLILGLMSGTSLDGLDLALCRISGAGRSTTIRIEKFETLKYSEAWYNRLKAIQSVENIHTLELTRLHSELGFLYGEMVLQCLEQWKVSPEEVDLIGCHGQTVYHAPGETEGEINATLQIVDADHIAVTTGIPVISDFRQKHTAAGGEGAPLAAIFDEYLFRSEDTHRMLLNLGGISNLTWLPATGSDQEIITGDVGPANTLINEAMQKHFGQPYDDAGKTAMQGTVHSELVRYILLEPYFRKAFPKTTGQEEFKLEYIQELMEGHGIELSPENLVASLSAVTSQSISRAVDAITDGEPFELYISGGGIYNRAITEDLKKRLPQAELRNLQHFGISAVAKEAAMMAFFANEFLIGNGFSIPGGGEEKVTLGKLSLG